LLCLIANYFLRNPKFEITKIEIEGNEIISASELEQYVSNQLAGTLLGLVHKNNKFVYAKQSMKADLVKKYPRLKVVSMDVTGGDLNVKIEEHSERYLYCLRGGACKYISEEAKIFGQAPTSTQDKMVTFNSALSYDSPEEVITFVLESIGIPIVSIDKRSGNKSVVHTALGFEIRYDSTEDAGVILKRLGLALSGDALPREKWTTLEYIDLRFGLKVFYRFKQ
jgi:hypothetical protein